MAGGGKHTWRSTGVPEKPPGGGGSDGDESGGDPCDIHFETTLNSVDESAIQKVTRGDRLSLSISEENNIPRLQASLDGVRLGIISHPKTLEVIRCIQAENRYVAVVVERQGNVCRVRVERQAP